MSDLELPWKVAIVKTEGTVRVQTKNYNTIFVADHNDKTEEIAAFIVKAVNNHERLLATLERVGDTLAYIVNHADIGVIYAEAKLATENAREAIKAAEE